MNLNNKEQAERIIRILGRRYGNVSPDLNYSNIYQLTIAVVLSAQTTDIQVNRITPELFRQYPDFNALSKAPLKNIQKIIQSTGFYRNKAKNIIALSKIIANDYTGQVPETREKLLTLPGVGRKSANVILSMGLGIQALAVDTHVARIAGRLGLTSSKNPLQIEKDLTQCIKISSWTKTHLLFIKHGRETCKARSPLCNKCPLSNICPSADILLAT